MEWKKLSKEDSAIKMNELRDNGFTKSTYEDMELRTALTSHIGNICDELQISVQNLKDSAYSVDFLFGLKLYEELSLKRNMTIRDASELGVWRHLSLNVVPDIVYSRYKDSNDRFWSSNRRIWLRAIWLYIHLSWQGSVEETRKTIQFNTTDEIVQLVERSGNFGYRVELYREIIKQYGKYISRVKGPDKSVRIESLFRKVMKLNTAKVQVIEPTLVKGGVETYVRSLFEYFEA